MKNETILLVATIGVLALITTTGAVQGQTNDSWEPVDTKGTNPNVSEVGAHRILAANDIDIEETNETRYVADIGSSDRNFRVGKDDQILLRLDNSHYTIYEGEQLSQLTDGYREKLHTDVLMATEESWQDYTNVNVKEQKFVGFNLSDDGIQTDADGSVYVRIESKSGEIPLQNVEVQVDNPDDDTPKRDDLTLTNPGTAEVYDGNPKSYQQLNREAIKNHFPETDRYTSLVPGSGTGTYSPRFEIQPNATVTSYFESNTHTGITDHYAGIVRITEGAKYDDYWVANNDSFTVLNVQDYRVVTPPDYSNTVTDGCSYSCNCDPDGGCETCYSDYEEYESWELNKTDVITGVEIRPEEGLAEAFGKEEDDAAQLVINVSKPMSGKIGPLSYVTAFYDHTYGIDYPSECSETDWEKTKNKQNTSEVLAFYQNTGLETVDTNDVNVTGYVINRNDDEQAVYFDIKGDQRPEENPIGSIRLKANDETAYDVNPLVPGDRNYRDDDPVDLLVLDSPWISYPQSLYNTVERRTASSTTYKPITVDPTKSTQKNVYRDYLSSNRYQKSQDGNMRITIQTEEQAQVFEGINIGRNVLSRKGNTTLYRTIGGPIDTSSGEAITDNPQAVAIDLFGESQPIEVKTREYAESNIELNVSGNGDRTPENQTVSGTLMDSNGNPIENREIQLKNAKSDTVTTNGLGEFTATPNSTGIFKAEFEGDNMRDELTRYYMASEDNNAIRAPLWYSFQDGPGEYLGDMIATLLSVAHWIALGLFAVWWTKFRRKN